MHVAHTSAETAERRRKKVEDVKKRTLYRRAHGLEKEGEEQGVLGGWLGRGGREGEEGDGRGAVVEGKGGVVVEDADPKAEVDGRGERELEEQGVYTDFEGRRRKPLKKWLGIW